MLACSIQPPLCLDIANLPALDAGDNTNEDRARVAVCLTRLDIPAPA